MEILLLGSSGQLGKSIITQKPNDCKLISFSKADLDISDKESLAKIIKNYQPDWIINAAAYTKVDDAEKNKDLAFKVNKDGPKYISEIINNYGGNLLHISTDFVFDGIQKVPYKPSDKTNPLSVYGLSKVLGEEEIKKVFSSQNRAVILRTSWLMGPYGNNFAKTMLKLHSEKEFIKVVKDQIGCPTTSHSLAKICWLIIKKRKLDNNFKFPEVMHWHDEGITNWYEIAKEIGQIGINQNLIKRKAKVISINSEDYITYAKRPTYSVLDIEETCKILNINPINWKESIFRSLRDYY